MTRQIVKVHATPFFKAIGDGQEAGLFEAIVSVFNNVDLVGDRILAGAFTRSLDAWSRDAAPIPVIFSHRWDDLDAHVGEVLEAAELFPGNPRLPESLKAYGGLWVRGKLDVDEDLAARKVFRLLKRRRVREFSFAYDVLDERPAADDPDVNELVSLGLIEVGPTLKGANPLTALVDVKQTIEVSGRRFSRYPAAAGSKEVVEAASADEPDDAGEKLVPKSEANYRPAEDAAPENCGNCRHYTGSEDSGVCALVEGRIDPGYVSDLFAVRGTSAAAGGAKAGRVLSAKNEATLREIAASLTDAGKKLSAVLQQVSSDDDDGKNARDDTSQVKAGPKGWAEEPSSPALSRLMLDVEVEALEAPIGYPYPGEA